jgi:hypothetical protein
MLVWCRLRLAREDPTDEEQVQCLFAGKQKPLDQQIVHHHFPMMSLIGRNSLSSTTGTVLFAAEENPSKDEHIVHLFASNGCSLDE